MTNKASKFIRNRGVNKISITSKTMHSIIWYISECYRLLCIDKPKYFKSKTIRKSTIFFEDYLKMEFVDEYLQKNKSKFSAIQKELVDITFNYETQKRFIDIKDGKQKPDKIDIYISRLGLQHFWNDTDENIYFSIECKRIKSKPCCNIYTLDTEKFANRNYLKTRLPYEGQIAFIENKNLNDQNVSQEINKRLPFRTRLKTRQLLKKINMHQSIDVIYNSKHNRSYGRKCKFEVYHFLFDYSSFVK